jgi:putative membrane protein
MNEHRNFIDYLLLVLKGVGMGAANKVPGVSGGIVAFVGGFYEEFIHSLQRLNKNALELLFRGKIYLFIKYINGYFLAAILFGMLISFFTVSKVLDFLIIHYELNVWSTFFGMIIGSIYSISKRFEKWDWKSISYLIIGAIIGLTISFLDPAMENDALWFVFICGVISVSGMTLPGLSGSFILIILGNYVLLLIDSVNALYDTLANIISFDFSFLDNPTRMRMLLVLIVFTIGSVTGMISFSHGMNHLLKKYKIQTIAVITGFIIGSLGVVWPWKETIFKTDELGRFVLSSSYNKTIQTYKRFIPEFNLETIVAIGYIIFGISLILLLECYGIKNKKSTKI